MKNVDAHIIKIVFGAVVCILGIEMLLREYGKKKAHTSKTVLMIIGILSGMLCGLFGVGTLLAAYVSRVTEEEMWNTVRNSDENYDGIFFYAVKTTGIFCRPSCRSKLPKKDNICYFTSAEEARKAGFRPCKRCRSDLLEYHPIDERILDVAYAAGFSSLSAFNRFFKKQVGQTPSEYRKNQSKPSIIKSSVVEK